MPLRTNDKAPHFAVFDIHGNLVDLSDYRNRKILLGFYRYASCPFSNLRINELKKYSSEFQEKGLEIITVFQSDKDNIRRYVGKQRPDFPIVDDPKMTLYFIYKVGSSFFKTILSWLNLKVYSKAIRKGFKPGKVDGNRFRLPAEFVLDSNLVIEKLKYGEDLGDFIPIDEIRSVL
jgi:peroxiredoxin